MLGHLSDRSALLAGPGQFGTGLPEHSVLFAGPAVYTPEHSVLFSEPEQLGAQQWYGYSGGGGKRGTKERNGEE